MLLMNVIDFYCYQYNLGFLLLLHWCFHLEEMDDQKLKSLMEESVQGVKESILADIRSLLLKVVGNQSRDSVLEVTLHHHGGNPQGDQPPAAPTFRHRQAPAPTFRHMSKIQRPRFFRLIATLIFTALQRINYSPSLPSTWTERLSYGAVVFSAINN